MRIIDWFAATWDKPFAEYALKDVVAALACVLALMLTFCILVAVVFGIATFVQWFRGPTEPAPKKVRRKRVSVE